MAGIALALIMWTALDEGAVDDLHIPALVAVRLFAIHLISRPLRSIGLGIVDNPISCGDAGY